MHSHPAITYNDQVPNFKVFPTPDSTGSGNGGSGDWGALDWNRTQMYNSLIADHGLTPAEAAARSASVTQFILGATGGMGTGSYELRGYGVADRDTITPGAKINLNLGLCGS